MIDLEMLERLGTPWFVCHDLNATGSTEIVIPTPLRRDPAPAHGDRFCEENQIVILGFVATSRVGSAGNGFYIKALGQDGIFRTLYRHISVGSGSVVYSVPECYTPLQKADFTNSPNMNPASLWIETVGTCTLGSCVSIWGIHTTHDWGNRGYTGSPILFPVIETIRQE